MANFELFVVEVEEALLFPETRARLTPFVGVVVAVVVEMQPWMIAKVVVVAAAVGVVAAVVACLLD